MVRKTTVLILTPTRPDEAQLQRLRSLSSQLTVIHVPATSLDDVYDEVWRQVDILYTKTLLPSRSAAPRLRWVHAHSAGIDHLLPNQLIGTTKFTNSSGVHAPATAEYVLMMMLALSHRIARILSYQQRAEWPKRTWSLFLPQELRGSTVGIVGYGSIGREVARLSRSFGMRVLAVKRDIEDLADHGWCLAGVGDPEGSQVEAFYPPDRLRSMLGECDFVVLATPLTRSTTRLIGKAELKSMKPTAMLINVARGGILDERALIKALRSRHIGGAALDVFAHQPLPSSSPLWTLPNVIISPHVAGFTPRYQDRAMDLFAENLERYLGGRTLLNEVDIARGY